MVSGASKTSETDTLILKNCKNLPSRTFHSFHFHSNSITLYTVNVFDKMFLQRTIKNSVFLEFSLELHGSKNRTKVSDHLAETQQLTPYMTKLGVIIVKLENGHWF